MGSQWALPAISLLFPHLLAPGEMVAGLRLRVHLERDHELRAGVLALSLFVTCWLTEVEPVP